jgi:hypothetical protein
MPPKWWKRRKAFGPNFPTDTGDWMITALDEDRTFRLKHEGKKLIMAIEDRAY